MRESRENQADDFTLTLIPEPDPPVTGEARLLIQVTDSQGEPVDDARLQVKGDMTHAGMQPVLAEITGGQAGLYTVPFTWTMPGDWIVTVEVTTPDGRAASGQFDLSVGS
jgi:hypothetical protein